jgi:hypothetical protein
LGAEYAHQRDIPEQRQRVAALLLKLTPVMFVFCYVLIAVVGAAMCLGWAGFCKLRGSKSADDLVWLNILLRLFMR